MTAPAKPDIDPLVYLRPWRAGADRPMIEEAAAMAQRAGTAVRFCPDGTLVLSCPTVEDALGLARRILGSLRRGHGAFVPVQCLLDWGNATDQAPSGFYRLPPGTPWATAAAREKSTRLEAVTRAMPPLPWFCVRGPETPSPIRGVLNNQRQTGPHPFCFYCGDRRHSAGDCPTKQTEAPPHALAALCRMGTDKMEALLWQGICGPPGSGTGTEAVADQPGWTAVRAIGFAFHIGMLRLVWDYRGRDWDHALAQTGPACRCAGAIWLAMDCLRTGRLDQAQSLLAGRGTVGFQSLTVQALVHAEQGRLDLAEPVLRQAMEKAASPVQKAYVLFLIQRVCRLRGWPNRAARALRRIKAIFPDCGQAIYEEIKLDFQVGRLTRAAGALAALIRRHPHYLAIAWIDPDLAGHEALIQPRLEHLLDDCRLQAGEQLAAVAEALGRLARFAGDGDPAVATCRQDLENLSDQAVSGSYVLMRQALEAIVVLREKIVRVMESRKQTMLTTVAETTAVFAAARTWCRRFPDPVKTTAERARLEAAFLQLEGLRASLQEAAAGAVEAGTLLLPKLSAEARQIIADLEKRWHRYRLQRFALSFVRRSLTWQGLNGLLGLIALPLANRAIGMLAPQAVLSADGLAVGQTALLTIGGVLGLMVASGQAFNRVYIEKNQGLDTDPPNPDGPYPKIRPAQAGR